MTGVKGCCWTLRRAQFLVLTHLVSGWKKTSKHSIEALGVVDVCVTPDNAVACHKLRKPTECLEMLEELDIDLVVGTYTCNKEPEGEVLGSNCLPAHATGM